MGSALLCCCLGDAAARDGYSMRRRRRICVASRLPRFLRRRLRSGRGGRCTPSPMASLRARVCGRLIRASSVGARPAVGATRALSGASAAAGKQKLIIFDTTLRDGEQSPGCTLQVRLQAARVLRLPASRRPHPPRPPLPTRTHRSTRSSRLRTSSPSSASTSARRASRSHRRATLRPSARSRARSATVLRAAPTVCRWSSRAWRARRRRTLTGASRPCATRRATGSTCSSRRPTCT